VQELRPTGFESFRHRAAIAAGGDITAEETESVGHDAELTAHDEVVFLLHTAAEVEHSLMVQYLYAAYSLGGEQVPPDKRDLVKQWRREIAKIAKEEMGHLASVQNLLHLIGGSLNLEREDFPFRNDLYPFRFKLEPLTKDSLAKYVFAEMPQGLEGEDIEEIKRRANRANMENPVNHVGALFEAIAGIFRQREADGSFSLPDTDLQADSVSYQAGSDWKGGNFVLEQVKDRNGAIKLIEDIAKQGEGLTDINNMANSHYLRFRRIYDAFPEAGDWEPSLRLPVNPNTTHAPDSDPGVEADLKTGRITNEKTRLWAQLLNMRYRMLLTDIFHAFHLKSDKSPDKENREILRDWSFQEMFSLGANSNLQKLSNILVKLPLHEAGAGDAAALAGPPFELPYSLNLPADERNRWRLHRDMIAASKRLTERILNAAEPTEEQRTYLNGLTGRDNAALAKANEKIAQAALAIGGNTDDTANENSTGESNMNRFTEVKNILENAVANTDIGAHGNFWRDRTRDEFVAAKIFGRPLFAKKADGTFDENESNLVKALQGRAPFGSDIGTPNATFRRMPAGFPPVPADKIAFIQQWIKDGCPDEEIQPQSVPPSFEADIKGLFRENPDRSSMLAIAQFDLHKFEDVRDRADNILARLEDGSMPCDGSWSEEKIAIFRKWIADGRQP
jgi:hypothetical protein